MRMTRMLGAVLVAVALLAGGSQAAEELKSGPQRPTVKIGAFNPLVCSGPDAGNRTSLVVRHGPNPVVLIFARAISEEVIALVKKVDEATVKNGRANLGSFLVVCSEEESMKGRLEELARRLDLKKCTLTLLERKGGPKGYDLHPDAEVTVVLYVKRNPKAQFAYKKGELKDKDVEAILAELPRILSGKR